jgi:hypothetical protein
VPDSGASAAETKTGGDAGDERRSGGGMIGEG